MMYLRSIGMILLAALVHASAYAAESPVLNVAGVNLGRFDATAIEGGLSVRVDLNGDDVTATYVTARFQNNAPRQRLASGFWQSWNERSETLLDNAFAASDDGTLTFEIVEEDVSHQFLPIVFTVAYRTEGGIKSGYVVID